MQKITTIREEIVKSLIATGKWSEEQARLGEQTGYACDYCGLDFLASVENYKMWQCDHIIPRNKGGSDAPDNLTVACRICNMDFKSTYDPRSDTPPNASREQLIEAVRAYIQNKKQSLRQEIEHVRQIVRYSPR